MTESKTTELHQGLTDALRVVSRVFKEAYAVAISVIAAVIAILALLNANSANSNSTRAEAKVDYELEATRKIVDQYTEEYRLQQVTYQAWREYARANGLPVNEIEEP